MEGKCLQDYYHPSDIFFHLVQWRDVTIYIEIIRVAFLIKRVR